MNVLLLGGSNAGLHYGWAAQLQAAAPEHEIVNRFLGAVGSLYGLFRLLEMERNGAPMPDLIVFEYTLNDMTLLDAGILSPKLLWDTLVAVADFCRQRQIPLLFLCLELRPTGRARVNACITRVKAFYAQAAREFGLSDCITVASALGVARPEDYVDKHHLNEAASKRVAEAVRAIISSGGVRIPQAYDGPRATFQYVPASDARINGGCRRFDLAATVYAGEFIEIARAGATHWPGRGLLVGLLLRSTQETGVYRIAVTNRALRKNAQSVMREIVPNLILLHYFQRPLHAKDDLIVEMPQDEDALMGLDNDRTVLEAPAQTPFNEQTLQIAGALFWRPAPLWRRWVDTVMRAARELRRGRRAS